MESEVKNLNENCKQYEKSINAFKEKETELNSEVKALNDKLSLLKNVNENSQFGHSQTIQQMKTEQQTKIAEREDQLRNEFLKNLDAVNEAFATRQKNLLESHNLLTEFASEMQVELENVSNENNRQSEYLQAHHNDYVRYSKEIFLRLKQERDEINE